MDGMQPVEKPLGVWGRRLQSDLAACGENPRKPRAARVSLRDSLTVPRAQGSHLNMGKVA